MSLPRTMHVRGCFLCAEGFSFCRVSGTISYMKVIITKNYQDMSAKAARFVLAQIWRKRDSVLGLATGSTPVGMYKQLAKAHQEGRADFSKVTTFNLDEYWGLPQTDPDSYHRFMSSQLFKKINISDGSTHIPSGDAADADAVCQEYEQQIKKSGGIDLQILGIGTNGHIGFNEPGTSFDSHTHLAALSAETRRKNAAQVKKRTVPSHAITMGLGTIMEARKIVLIASGKEKAHAIADAIEGKVSTRNPASVLQWHPDVTVILDEAAASKLKSNYRSPLLFAEGDIELLTKSDLPEGKQIMVISPHPDDASISLGGIISALTNKNDVHVVIMTTGYRSVVEGKSIESVIKTREHEAQAESRVLGSKLIFLHASFYDAHEVEKAVARDARTLEQYVRRIKPDILFVPNTADKHPTHKLSRETARRAVERWQRTSGRAVEWWDFEGPWSQFSEGDFNTIFAFDEAIMKKKMRAIALQKSQIERTRFDIAAKALAELRGALVPEQALVGYGAKAPKLGKYFELFRVTQV